MVDLKGDPTIAVLNGYAVRPHSKYLSLSIHGRCGYLHNTGARSNQSKFQHIWGGATEAPPLEGEILALDDF